MGQGNRHLVDACDQSASSQRFCHGGKNRQNISSEYLKSKYFKQNI